MNPVSENPARRNRLQYGKLKDLYEIPRNRPHAIPEVSINRRLMRERDVKIKTKMINQAQREEGGMPEVMFCLKDEKGVVTKSRAMTVGEAYGRNRSIKDLGYEWVRGGW